ncbi:hypothetical protein J2S74_002038 [Evansella vedderi]|uniref:Uncharacterized protein n=1 Tax=Evansella vedderi TaxID=38282 RepID=A0ABT9ZTX6_9BACI|nr:hypothetical protein [Evansella vedderi]MDQ0254659.1 hypothetical protein [Evansella vedderi]
MDKKNVKEDVNAAVGGMGIFGTTGNVEIEGYEMSGDIENAGQLDKGFKKDSGTVGAKATLEENGES